MSTVVTELVVRAASRISSGHSGIYTSQRIWLSKYSAVYLEEGVTLANYGQKLI